MSELIFLMIWSWCLNLMKSYDFIYELFSIILSLDGEKVQNGIRYARIWMSYRCSLPSCWHIYEKVSQGLMNYIHQYE